MVLDLNWLYGLLGVGLFIAIAVMGIRANSEQHGGKKGDSGSSSNTDTTPKA